MKSILEFLVKSTTKIKNDKFVICEYTRAGKYGPYDFEKIIDYKESIFHDVLSKEDYDLLYDIKLAKDNDIKEQKLHDLCLKLLDKSKDTFRYSYLISYTTLYKSVFENIKELDKNKQYSGIFGWPAGGHKNKELLIII